MHAVVRLCLLCFMYMLVSPAMTQYIPKFDVQGHRGAKGLAPENTIPAFLAALENGVTTIELDVVITADNKVVVSHEPWISAEICLDKDGTTIRKSEEKHMNIFKMKYEEVMMYDCGTKVIDDFPDQKKISVSKPLLRDVIVAVEDHIRSYTQYEVDYSIEIKSTKDGDDEFHPAPEIFSDIVYELINQYLPLNRVVIQSFDLRVLKYWHKKYPQVRLSLVIDNLKSVSRNLSDLGFNPSVYSPHYRPISKASVDYLHTRKIRVIPWTVNDIDAIQRLKALGVDGVITDYPNKTFELGLGVKRPATGKSAQKNSGRR